MDPLRRNDVELAQAKAPGEKLAEALELMATGIRLKRTALRRQHPDASEAELEALFLAWLMRNE